MLVAAHRHDSALSISAPPGARGKRGRIAGTPVTFSSDLPQKVKESGGQALGDVKLRLSMFRQPLDSLGLRGLPTGFSMIRTNTSGRRRSEP